MVYILISIIVISNLAWLYAWTASVNSGALNWLVALLGPEGATSDMFVPSAIIIAFALQICLGAFLLWENSRRKSLTQKLKNTRNQNKDLAHSSKEIERKISTQEKELQQAKGSEERAELLETQVADLESFNAELKKQNIEFQNENDTLVNRIGQLEQKLSAGPSSGLGQQIKSWFTKP